MEYRFKQSALEDLENLPKAIQRRIVEKLEFYAKTEKPLRFAEKLKEPVAGEYRFRMGAYRVAFDVIGETIVILRIGHRKGIYQ